MLATSIVCRHTTGNTLFSARTFSSLGRKACIIRGSSQLLLRRISSSELGHAPVKPQRVVDFWFNELAPEQHWVKDPELDERIRTEFGQTHELALCGKLDEWANQMPDCLALVVVLDQFSRNLYRGTVKAFAGDVKALQISKRAIEAGFHLSCDPCDRQASFYLPFMHSEDLGDQKRCVDLYDQAKKSSPADNKSWAEVGRDFAVRHLVIVERFGRFPHRNDALGRTCTPEEVEFLKQPGSSF